MQDWEYEMIAWYEKGEDEEELPKEIAVSAEDGEARNEAKEIDM